MAILTNLLEHPELRPATEALIARVFPAGTPLPSPQTVSAEFPLLLEEANAERTLVLCDDDAPDRPIASASYRIFEYGELNSPKLLRLAGIGLVVTDPAARGKGYASHLLLACEARARREGAACAVLWSDLVSFYEKNGYLVGGTEISWLLEEQSLNLVRERLRAELSPSQSIAIELTNGALSTDTRFALRRIYEGSGIGPRRDVSSYAAFEAMPGLDRWVARSQTGQIVGSALVGKGRDLTDTLHEWTGESRTWPWILRAILEGPRTRLRIQLPYDHPHRAEIEHWLGQGEKTPLAFWKTLDSARLANWIRQREALPKGVDVLVTGSASAQTITVLNAGTPVFESRDPAHLLQIFLGPWTPDEMDDVPFALREALKGAKLPVCPYFWGLDSV